MQSPKSSDSIWASGYAYEPYVGRWSRLVAREFLNWLGMPSDCSWLDVGCGTGALCQVILDHVAPSSVTGVDASVSYLNHAQQHITDERVRFEVGDAQSLPMDDQLYEVAVSGLVLNFVPQPELMVNEMMRSVHEGGTVALYVWDYAGEMQLMRHFWNAAVALDPAVRAKDEGVRFPICKPEPLHALFEGAKLQNVEVRSIDVATHFRDFDDYWTPFLGGQAPAPSYAMSLDDTRRTMLRDHIHAHLPIAADGSIDLIARAWQCVEQCPDEALFFGSRVW
jgi:trans-aconitate methyltransferase